MKIPFNVTNTRVSAQSSNRMSKEIDNSYAGTESREEAFNDITIIQFPVARVNTIRIFRNTAGYLFLDIEPNFHSYDEETRVTFVRPWMEEGEFP